jgi:transposase
MPEKKTKKPRKPTYVKSEARVRGAFTCEWCKKVFSSENIMITHMCEFRRRYMVD